MNQRLRFYLHNTIQLWALTSSKMIHLAWDCLFFKLNFKQNFSFEHIAFIDSGIILFDEQMDPRKASIFISILISVLGIVILVSNMRVHWSLVMNKRNWFCVSGYKHRANEGVCFFGEVKMRAHTLRVWTNEMARFFFTYVIADDFCLPDWNAPNKRSKRKYIIHAMDGHTLAYH